jgi:hypothetical protein
MALGVNRTSVTAVNAPAIVELAVVAEPHDAIASPLNSNLPTTATPHSDASASFQATATALDSIPSVEQDVADTGSPSELPDAAIKVFDDTDTDDDLKPARGFLNGILLAVPLWAVIGLLVWFFLGR